MSELDNLPGNINSLMAEASIRAVHDGELAMGEAVFFASYLDAPFIVDWLAVRNLQSRYEQRANEGVTIIVGKQRALVGDWIIVKDDTVRVTRFVPSETR